nr:hypothetical protein GCM10020093_107990 [Planobispora longispora]
MIEDAYPLAALQAGMLFHSELDASTYHDLTTLTVRGRFDREAMEATLSDLAARHPILRTGFDLTGFSEPLQLVHDAATIPLEVVESGRAWRPGARTRSAVPSTGAGRRCCGSARTCWSRAGSR